MSLPQPERGSASDTPPGIPRWVKVSGIIAIVVVLLVLILFALGGNHGPSQHLPSGDAGGYLSPIAHQVHQL